MKMPEIGLGTWELHGEVCIRVVREALEIGYRHIDTAHVYQNHKAIGAAIKGKQRDQLFLTSKIALADQVDKAHAVVSVRQACEMALQELDTDYIDLYLIHAPNRGFPMADIFATMLQLAQEGKIRKAGVSNFTIHHLQDLQREGMTPFANQVELHPYLPQHDLYDYCNEQGIKLISFRSFGKGKLLQEEPLFKEIGDRYCKSGAQIILRWLLQKNIASIPKATSERHLRENLAVTDFTLSDAEMDLLDSLSQQKRYCRAEDPEYAY